MFQAQSSDNLRIIALKNEPKLNLPIPTTIPSTKNPSHIQINFHFFPSFLHYNNFSPYKFPYLDSTLPYFPKNYYIKIAVLANK
jgi:hypothetical protein